MQSATKTTLSIDQHKALSDEVDEVWKTAVKDVEHYGYTKAIIQLQRTAQGHLRHHQPHAHLHFEKGSDGKWTRLSRPDLLAAE